MSYIEKKNTAIESNVEDLKNRVKSIEDRLDLIDKLRDMIFYETDYAYNPSINLMSFPELDTLFPTHKDEIGYNYP